jgi:hypothetical protein
MTAVLLLFLLVFPENGKDDPVQETIRGKNWRKFYSKQQGFYTKLCLNFDL